MSSRSLQGEGRGVSLTTVILTTHDSMTDSNSVHGNTPLTCLYTVNKRQKPPHQNKATTVTTKTSQHVQNDNTNILDPDQAQEFDQDKILANM